MNHIPDVGSSVKINHRFTGNTQYKQWIGLQGVVQSRIPDHSMYNVRVLLENGENGNFWCWELDEIS